jgi:ribosomal protein L37AE/L43A
MKLSQARYVEEDAQHECPVCGADEEYVLYEGDKMCSECGHAPDPGARRSVTANESPWESWWDHREQYDGFYGENRVRMVGGFVSTYF